jgi:hydrogenase maturation protein HypF
MLPYTPLHHLLMRAMDGRPLVMTSGNRCDEPIVYQDDGVVARLGSIADLLLTHDRTIHVRADDSVTRVLGKSESPVRRSRGYAPRPVKLPFDCPRPTLAVGGQFKATFALARGRLGFLSHHLGDLDDYDAYQAFERDTRLYEQLFEIRPQWVVHDLHPDYASTRYALSRGGDEAVTTVAVQHHHAHVASCMAENNLSGDVIGIAFDGTGYGTDGTIWGGEFLVANYRQFRRAAHLRRVALPGGDKAALEPWRSAASYLIDAGLDLGQLESVVSTVSLRTVGHMIARRVNSPLSSSMGRLFDAVAAISGIRSRVTFEGQAAMALEWLATPARIDGSYPFVLQPPTPADAGQPYEIDTRPLIVDLARDVGLGVHVRRVARRFQSTLVEIIAATCARIRTETNLNRVALSGGVFMNMLLTREATQRLKADGFRVFRHRLVPPNDGGLSLGQVAVAAALASNAARVDQRLQPTGRNTAGDSGHAAQASLGARDARPSTEPSHAT